MITHVFSSKIYDLLYFFRFILIVVLPGQLPLDHCNPQHAISDFNPAGILHNVDSEYAASSCS
jgi:hypothetical protein